MTRPVGEDDLMAWIDGRLTPERRALVDDFLAASPDVRERLVVQAEQARVLAAALAPVAAEPVPAALRVSAVRERRRRPIWRDVIAASLLLGLGFGIGWAYRERTLPPRAGIQALAEEATDSYRVYAADPFRAAEIGPEQEPALVRWMSSRLGGHVGVPDLSRVGYRFVGGRLVATSHGPAALFLYEGADRDRLALMTRPMEIDKTVAMAVTSQGSLNRVSWAKGGRGYSVVGNRAPAMLHPIAEEVRQQVSAT